MLAKSTCKRCNGTGYVQQTVDLPILFDMAPDFEGRKIDFIKTVRDRWQLTLVDAKNLVESVINFEENI